MVYYGYFRKVVEENDVNALAEANLQLALNMGYLLKQLGQ